MTTTGGTPAGWYDDGSGQQRWYDGTAWTEHVHPPAAAAPAARPTPDEAVRAATAAYRPPAQTYAPLPPEELVKKPKPFYTRPIALVILLALVVVAIALLVL